jgi:hypothetical protein
VKLASRGQRDMDAGPEPIGDPQELRQIRRQARMVYAKAAGFAGALTALALLL